MTALAVSREATATSALPLLDEPASEDLPAADEPGQSPDDQGPPIGSYFPLNVSLLYPIATNAGRPSIKTNFDLALLVGHVGAVEGIQVGVVPYTAYEIRGVQVALAALAGGAVAGAQVGGTFALLDGPLEGLQLAGIFGWATREIRGAQVAGVASQTFEDVQGLQLAGGVNIARREITGVEAAGFLNIGRVRGLQLGLINVSAEVNGLQLGLINVARRIKGLQIGVINVTDSLSGESLGIANILRPGAIHLSFWGSSSMLGNAGVKFASKYAYSILSAGLHNEEGERSGAAGLTLGIRLPVSIPWLTLSADLGGYRRFPGRLSFAGHNELYKTRLILSLELAPRLSLFLGGGGYLTVRGDENISFGAGPELAAGVEL